MQTLPKKQRDRLQAQSWAQYVLSTDSPPCAILDTETTGLDGNAEICDIALIDCLTGDILYDSLVRPVNPIPAELTEKVHGIDNGMVSTAPRFDEVWLPLLLALGDRQLIIYNASYDLRLIRQSAAAYDFHPQFTNQQFVNGAAIHCAMLQYSAWVGDWNYRKGNYTWQKLQGGNHRAAGDCLATLDTIKRMAAG